MTPQEVIKTFMSSLVNHGADTSSSVGTAMLDEAVKASSRFLGIQNAIDNIKADQTQAERDAVEEILGSAYTGKTISEVGSTILNASAKTYSSTKASNAYADDQNDGRTTVKRAILERKAYIFLEKYCGIQLSEKYFLTSDTAQTYWSDEDGFSGNVDTGAITGSDANITLKTGDVVYGTTLTSALMKDYAKQDGSSLSGDTLTIGTGTEKTSSDVVPEIGNKYTATAAAAQNINTGSHDWLVVATAANDTITAGGADSIDAGAGNDKITVGADYASVLTGAGNDTVEIAAAVNNVTLNDLSSTDNVNIKGTFSIGSAQIDDTTLILNDKSGNRTIYFGNYADASNAKVNGTALGTWLGNAGINIENASPASQSESATVDGDTSAASGQIDSDTPHFPPTADENAAVTGSQTLSKLNLDDVKLIEGDILIGKNKVGEISSEFPNVSTFTKNGLTIRLYGVSSDKNGSDSKVTAKTLDELTDDQRTVVAGLFKWWAKECLNLNEESYGTSFKSATAGVKDIDLIFYDSKGSGNTLASVGYTSSGGKVLALTLKINMNYYKGIAADDADGTGKGTSALLDRTLAHEFTHAVMAANINNFDSLPQFITEGTAELTHGIDDTRSDTIFGLAYNSSNFAKALDLKNTGTGTVNAYAGGYMFMRYLAKQGALQLTTNYANPDAGASWSLNGTTATYTVDGQVVATLSGLAQGLAVRGTEIEGISVSGNVITLSKAVLGTSKVSLGKNDNFTLALGADLSDNLVEITNLQWSVKTGTATLSGDYSTGYQLTDEGKSITYQQAKSEQTLATVKGLAKTDTVKASDFPASGNVITLKASMLGETSVTLTGDGYTLALADNAPVPTVQTPAWTFSGTTGTYSQNSSAGFKLSEDAKTAFYSGVTTAKLATLSGIKKVDDTNKAAIAAAVKVSGTTITVGADALATSKVSLGKNDDFTLALADNAPKPTLQTPALTLSGTTATYAQGTSAGFTLSEDEKSLTYAKESSKTLATVSGITKVTDDNKAAVAAAIGVNGTTITLGKDALGTSNVKVTGDDYTLALADNAPKPTAQTPAWTLSGTTATYAQGTSAGFTLSEDEKSLTYAKESSKTLATVSGITKVTDDNKAAVAAAIGVNGTTITVGKDALAASNVKVTGEGYTLTLANNAPIAAIPVTLWEVNGTKAVYKKVETGYFTKKDDTAYNYNKENVVETYATINGLRNGVSTENFSLSGNVITLNAEALDEVPTEKTKVTLGKNDEYTLKLANGIANVAYNEPAFSFDKTAATLAASVKTAGYSTASDGKSITYVPEGTSKTLATVTGIKPVDATNKETVAKAVNLSGKKILLNKDALTTTNVKVTGDGYTLALASEALKPLMKTPVWELKGTNAAYKQDKSAGYETADEGKSIKYLKESTSTLATLSGIVKVDDTNKETVSKAIKVSSNVITLGKDALGTSAVKVKGEGYTLALADNAPVPAAQAPAWTLKGTNATYVQSTSDGFTPSEDNKALNYSKAILETLATVSGIKKVTDDNKAAIAAAISAKDNVVTLGKDALGTSAVKVKGEGYTLALADNAPTAAAESTLWEVKGNKAVYKTVNTGYFTKKDDTSYIYNAEKLVETLATVTGIKKDAPVDSISLSDKVITLKAAALDEAPTAKTKITLGKKDDYTLKLDNGIANVVYNTPEFTFNKTAATLEATVKTAGYSASSDGKTITYIPEKDAKGNVTTTTLATVSGIVKVDENNQTAVEKAITFKDNVITLGKAALGTAKVTVKGDYTLALADNSLKPTLQTPDWQPKGTSAAYVQETSEGFTLSEDQKTLSYSKAKPVTLATVSGIQKVTDDNKAAIKAAISISDKVVTLGKDALGTSAVKVKGDGYTLKLADNAPVQTELKTLWEVSGTKAVYKDVNTGYFTKKDDTSYNYTKEKVVTTHATVSGLKKGATVDSISLSGNVITLAATALDDAPNAKTKVTLGKKDNYTLKLADGIDNVTYDTPVWSYDKNKATYDAAVNTAGYSTSADGKTITYIPKTDAKGNAVTATLATLTGVKSAEGITTSGKVISLGADALNEKKVSLAKNDDFTLALADASLAPVAESDETWIKNGNKATLSVTLSKGYTASDDAKTLNYSAKSTDKILAQITGINKDAFINSFVAVADGDTKKVTLNAAQLTDKVTVSGEYKFSFADDFNNASITGSAGADNISVAGTGLIVNPGKGDDSVSLGGSANTVLYANGDGCDVIADFTAATDKIKVTKGTPELAASGSDAVINVGTGSIKLTGAASALNAITILDKDNNRLYPVQSAALLDDDHFVQDDLHDITADLPADASIADFSFKQDATALDTPTVTFGDHDK